MCMVLRLSGICLFTRGMGGGGRVTLNLQIYTNCLVGKCLLHRCALYDGVNLSFSIPLPEKTGCCFLGSKVVRVTRQWVGHLRKWGLIMIFI